MTTRGSRPNSSAWRTPHVADPLERAAVGDDQQVVGRVGIGIGAELLDTGDERHRAAGSDRCTRHRRGRPSPRPAERRRASRPACPRPGSRGPRPGRDGRPGAAPRRPMEPPRDTVSGRRSSANRIRVDATTRGHAAGRFAGVALPLRSGRGRPTAALRPGLRRDAAEQPASGATRSPGCPCPGSSPPPVRPASGGCGSRVRPCHRAGCGDPGSGACASAGRVRGERTAWRCAARSGSLRVRRPGR